MRSSGALIDGRYQLLSPLGQGGMAVIYKARALETGAEVALKLLPPTGDRKRFETEALALARLQHPNIISVKSYGEHGDRPYLVMNLVEGETLAERIEQAPLEPREAARIVRALAEALAHAHAAGVLHRDLKPENVMLMSDGTPVLIDFGLALDLDLGLSQRLSKTGAVMGTPAYFSPEQVRGERRLISERTDIYGLGGILYSALTQRPPVNGENIFEIIVAATDQVPPAPSRIRRGVPAELDAICMRCLEKAQDDRFASAVDLADALDAYLRSGSTRVRAGLYAAAGGSLALLGVSVALVLSETERTAERPTPKQALAPAPEERPPVPTPPDRPADPPPDPGLAVDELLAAARAHHDAERAKPALSAIDEALALEPDSFDGLLLKAAVLNKWTDDSALALECSERALRLRPGNDRAREVRAVTLHNLGRDREALAELDAVIARTPTANSYFARAVAVQALGSPEAALHDLGRSLELDPDNLGARVFRGWVRMETRQFTGAIDDLTVVIERRPGATALQYRGMARFQSGLYADAEDDLTRSLTLAPTLAESYFVRAHVRLKLERPREALEDLTRTLEFEPTHHQALRTLGGVRLQLGDVEGLKDMERAIELAPPEYRARERAIYEKARRKVEERRPPR